MAKLMITLLDFLVILALQIFPGDVSVKLDVPSEVQAGSEFDVRITFNKGDLTGFTRFQQIVPAGLTATSGSSANADFSFSEKRVRLIWLRIPETDEVAVTYRVKVDERLKGTFTLGGKFSYIENNERKSVDIDPVAIRILPSSEIDPSLMVDVNDFEKMTIPHPGALPADASDIACIRQVPYAGVKGDYIVNVLVSKKSANRFAKIEENVPEGYTAVALDTKNAIFTFKDNTVKFLWMNMPQEPYFTVAYRLIPKNQAHLPAPSVKGAFSYLIDDKTMSIDILERDLNLADLKGKDMDALVANAISEQPPLLSEKPVEQSKSAEVQAVMEDKVKTEEVKKPEPVRQEQPVATKPVAPTAKTDISYALEPETGVYYRIQIAAGHKPVNIIRYFRRLKIEKEVRKEDHDGWQKYSIGSFNLYKEARDYRIHIWNTTPVKDAFITAYNNGQRITVQEALMITEQKWYR